jgi:hypothetical protein
MTLTGAPSTGTKGWHAFQGHADDVVGRHPVVVDNRYTRWFATGEANRADVRHLTVQFSVFSHLFVEAQLRKVINAPDLASYRAGKEILMNELGVPFRPPRGAGDGDVEADLVSTEGSVEGARFRFPAAHFEWLLRFAEPLGLGFGDLGKRRQATPATAFFCDELLRIYGSADPSVAAGASYAVEHWAAAGFWKELIGGLRIFSERECPDLPLSFWTWHDRVEDQHAAHTADELAEAFSQPGFDQERFLAGAGEMLDGVNTFWDGLDRDRLEERAP